MTIPEEPKLPEFSDSQPLRPTDSEQSEQPGEEPASDAPYRGSGGDPIFGFLLALAVSVGLIPTLPGNTDLRYTLAWGALAGVGVIAWLLGNAERIEQEQPENLGWGVGFGLLVAFPFALFFSGTFGIAARLMFPELGAGVVVAYLVFVMPLAETLFFRGLLQNQLEFYIVGGLGGLWSVLLFFPVMWGEIISAPAVGFMLAIALFGMNLMYSYVKDRNGLAAAWVSQIVANLLLFFLPLLLGTGS